MGSGSVVVSILLGSLKGALYESTRTRSAVSWSNLAKVS